MNKKIVTMSDIAKQLNISKVSVHKALNNQVGISQELKEKILKTATELGYNMIDPLTKLCRHYFFILHKRFYFSTEQFYFGIFTKLKEMFSQIGCSIELYSIDDNFNLSDFTQNASRLINDNFGFFIGGQLSKKTLSAFSQSKLPCICIDYYSNTIPLNYIYIDNFQGGYYLTNMLIKNGHKKICFIIDVSSATTNMDKYFGFRKSLMKNNIKFTDDMHINTSLTSPVAHLNFKMPNPMPTAFILDSDFAAYNFLVHLSSKKYNIPYDISVASFDNTALATECNPSLTSMGVSPSEIADSCYEAMLTQLNSKNSDKHVYTLMPKLYIRNSVKMINESKK